MIWFFTNGIIAFIPSRHIRYILYKLLGMKIGGNVSIFMGTHIRNPKGVFIGEGASIGSIASATSFLTAVVAALSIYIIIFPPCNSL